MADAIEYPIFYMNGHVKVELRNYNENIFTVTLTFFGEDGLVVPIHLPSPYRPEIRDWKKLLSGQDIYLFPFESPGSDGSGEPPIVIKSKGGTIEFIEGQFPIKYVVVYPFCNCLPLIQTIIDRLEKKSNMPVDPPPMMRTYPSKESIRVRHPTPTAGNMSMPYGDLTMDDLMSAFDDHRTDGAKRTRTLGQTPEVQPSTQLPDLVPFTDFAFPPNFF